MQRSNSILIILGIVGIVTAYAIASWNAENAIRDLEDQYKSAVNVYLYNRLDAWELQVVGIGENSISGPVKERLETLGARVVFADLFSATRHVITDRMVYIIEDNVIASNLESPQFLEFIKDAAESHSTLVAVGSDSMILKKAIDKSGINGPTGAVVPQGGWPILAFKVTEVGVPVYTIGPPVHDVAGGKLEMDQALFILEFVREEADMMKDIIQSTPVVDS